MGRVELLEMRVFRSRKMVVVEKTETSSKSMIVPADPEICCYQLTDGKFLEIKHTDSANPYWHSADYEMRDGDVVVREARIWVTEIAPIRDSIGAFQSREDFVEMMTKHWSAEILESVVSE